MRRKKRPIEIDFETITFSEFINKYTFEEILQFLHNMGVFR